MQNWAIRTRDLTKVYRLYTKPVYRFLDMFGMLGSRTDTYSEHAALDGVSLDIMPGEKVAIIGRNGAGKSTFLKLVTNVIEPTAGSIEVRGKVHALLQIGTGFHPDFTGRENVYAYLAQLGVSGAPAERLCADIIDFAELESYIDQPVKTYSTGMGVRLMFATSTAITPDLLVLDEVLGVGDAYFAHKSFERMKEMCERQGTTLLLVTHDIYSAVKLCPRVVWIDRGRVLMDGDAALVVKAYEDSVRQQEEQRLRDRKQQRLKEIDARAPEARQRIAIEIRARNNEPQRAPVYFSRIGVTLPGGDAEWLPLDEIQADPERSHLDTAGMAWGDAGEWQGRRARPLLNYGSPFHKVGGVITLPASIPAGSLTFVADYWSDAECDVVVQARTDKDLYMIGTLPPVAGAWRTHEANLDQSRTDVDRSTELSMRGRHGTGAIAVLDARTVDGRGEETHGFRFGEPFELHIHYQINQPTLAERPQVVVVFHRDGIINVCRLITRELHFDAARQPRGLVRLRLPHLPLVDGTYTITIMIVKEGYYDRDQSKYFSLNPEVYCGLSRILEISVAGAGLIGAGTGVILEGAWALAEEPQTHAL